MPPASTWMFLPPQWPTVTLTFDLQNLSRSSVGYSLMNNPCKFHWDCSRHSWDIVVMNRRTDERRGECWGWRPENIMPSLMLLGSECTINSYCRLRNTKNSALQKLHHIALQWLYCDMSQSKTTSHTRNFYHIIFCLLSDKYNCDSARQLSRLSYQVQSCYFSTTAYSATPSIG